MLYYVIPFNPFKSLHVAQLINDLAGEAIETQG